MENVLDAVLWGVAAAAVMSEAVPGTGIVLSMAASMFPMAASLAMPSSSQPSQLTVPYSAIAGDIAQQYADGTSQVVTYVTAISGDQVALPFVGAQLNGLPSNNLWKITAPQISDYANAALNPSYIRFYSILIPAAFNIWSYQGVNSQTPFYCSMSYYPIEKYWRSSIAAPTYAYQSISESNGNWDIYMMCQGSDGSSLIFPPEEMFTDLFTNLNVSPSDLFQAQGVWSGIPVIQPDVSNC